MPRPSRPDARCVSSPLKLRDSKPSGFRIVYREWPEGYDPLSKGERPEDRRVHGKLALPPLKPLKGPTPDANGNGSH